MMIFPAITLCIGFVTIYLFIKISPQFLDFPILKNEPSHHFSGKPMSDEEIISSEI